MGLGSAVMFKIEAGVGGARPESLNRTLGNTRVIFLAFRQRNLPLRNIFEIANVQPRTYTKGTNFLNVRWYFYVLNIPI